MASFDPSESAVGEDLNRGVNLFRKAHVGDAAPVPVRAPGHVLAVLDGSGQDACTLGLARHLKDRYGCRVSVADARESDDAVAPAENAAADLGGAVVPRSAGASSEQILAAAERSGCDLTIVPCPFGRESEGAGPQSAGPTADVLLARCPTPMLVVREPFAAGGAGAGRIWGTEGTPPPVRRSPRWRWC